MLRSPVCSSVEQLGIVTAVLFGHSALTGNTHVRALDNANYRFTSRTAKVKRLKVSTFIYRHLQGNPGQQWFTIEVAY